MLVSSTGERQQPRSRLPIRWLHQIVAQPLPPTAACTFAWLPCRKAARLSSCRWPCRMFSRAPGAPMQTVRHLHAGWMVAVQPRGRVAGSEAPFTALRAVLLAHVACCAHALLCHSAPAAACHWAACRFGVDAVDLHRRLPHLHVRRPETLSCRCLRRAETFSCLSLKRLKRPAADVADTAAGAAVMCGRWSVHAGAIQS